MCGIDRSIWKVIISPAKTPIKIDCFCFYRIITWFVLKEILTLYKWLLVLKFQNRFLNSWQFRIILTKFANIFKSLVRLLSFWFVNTIFSQLLIQTTLFFEWFPLLLLPCFFILYHFIPEPLRLSAYDFFLFQNINCWFW